MTISSRARRSGRIFRVKVAKWTLAVTSSEDNRPRMPIPPLDANGHLPPGVHDASLAEIRRRFGRFQGTERRVRLQAALEAFVAEARVSGLVSAVIVNGSFTTWEEEPGDIDIIILLRTDLKLATDLRPDQYNVVSARRVRSRYPLDARVFPAGSAALEPMVDFFAQVRGQPGARKGMIRVTL